MSDNNEVSFDFQKLMCKFGFHDYDKLEIIEHGNATQDGRVIGKYFHQKRICNKCGLSKFKKDKVL